MVNKLKKIRGNILIELIIKGYTESFLKTFLIFLKQRFFKNFVKNGSNTTIFNKYTLLRSSFVNKSSREQIEKRIYKKKINLVFSEFDFKYFYSSLNTLNFKGISLKLSKYFFFDKFKKTSSNPSQFKLKGFNFLWDSLSFNKKKLIMIKANYKNLHQVFPLIGIKKNNFSKFIGLKFLKSRSLRKNRLKTGLFKILKKKSSYLVRNVFSKSFDSFMFNKRKTYLFLKKNKNPLLKLRSNFFLLGFSYNISVNKKQKVKNFSFLSNFLSIKEKNLLLNNKSMLNSVIRYRKYFIWPLFINNREVSDYRGGLSRISLIDKLNINFKLILGLKLKIFSVKHNIFFSKNLNFFSIMDKNFYRYLVLLNKNKFTDLNQVFYKKSLLVKINPDKTKFLLDNYKKLKTNSGQITINPWLIRRFFIRSLKGNTKKKILQLYEKNIVVKSLNSSFYFRSKPLYFFLLLYIMKIKNSTGKRKFHLEKRFRYLLKRNWGLIWRFKSKNRFFFKSRRKKSSWKKFHRSFKNKYQKKKQKFKKNNNRFRKAHKKNLFSKKKRFLNVFSLRKS
jgi:hypothetical protein